jgi:hypothetical protein
LKIAYAAIFLVVILLLSPLTLGYTFTEPYSMPYEAYSQVQPCYGTITEQYGGYPTDPGIYESYADAVSDYAAKCTDDDASIQINEQLHGGYYTAAPCESGYYCTFDFTYSFTVTSNLYWQCVGVWYDQGSATPHAQIQFFFAIWDNSNGSNVIGNTFTSPSALSLFATSSECEWDQSGTTSGQANPCAQTFTGGQDVQLLAGQSFQPRVGLLASTDTGDGTNGMYHVEAKVDLWNSNTDCNGAQNGATLNYMNFQYVSGPIPISGPANSISASTSLVTPTFTNESLP